MSWHVRVADAPFLSCRKLRASSTHNIMPVVLVSSGRCLRARKLVLDVGCGMGRFADVATRWGAHVVCVDLSLAAEVAARNLADRSATFFQADVFNLPFASESFDYIYSIGVEKCCGTVRQV